MVDLRIDVSGALGVHGLMRRLAVMLDRSAVSFDGLRAWLDETGMRSAELWLGDGSFTVVGPLSLTKVG
jgi:hypothetical protein